jgi:hypothetical protein
MSKAAGPPQASEHRPNLRERAREELVSYAVVSAYLFVCFAAVLFYKSALLREEGVAFLPLGIAAVKALVIGKFILIGEAVGVGTLVTSGTRLRAIVTKIVLLFLLLVALLIIEELIVGRVHGRSMAETLAEFAERPRQELLASCLLLLLILVPLVTVRELGRALGPGGLQQLLRHPARQGD